MHDNLIKYIVFTLTLTLTLTLISLDSRTQIDGSASRLGKKQTLWTPRSSTCHGNIIITCQKEEKECIPVKYLIYAVVSQFQICCHLRIFSPKSVFPKFLSFHKKFFSKSACQQIWQIPHSDLMWSYWTIGRKQYTFFELTVNWESNSETKTTQHIQIKQKYAHPPTEITKYKASHTAFEVGARGNLDKENLKRLKSLQLFMKKISRWRLSQTTW